MTNELPIACALRRSVAYIKYEDKPDAAFVRRIPEDGQTCVNIASRRSFTGQRNSSCYLGSRATYIASLANVAFLLTQVAQLDELTPCVRPITYGRSIIFILCIKTEIEANTTQRCVV